MQKNILIYGLIAGAIVSVLMLLSVNFLSHQDGISYDTSLVIGYASMLIAFSIVIVLIASTIYVIAWMIDYYFFIPDFMEKYSAHVIDELKASGASQTEIDEQMKEMSSFGEMYKNPFFNAMMTYVEILPVGLILTLISALILKRKTIATA